MTIQCLDNMKYSKHDIMFSLYDDIMFSLYDDIISHLI